MTNEIISAFLLGLVGGVIPGPVLAATFTEILQSGFWKSFRIILWAMLTEAVIALVSLLVLSSFHLSNSFFNAISIIGAGILAWIAVSIWKIRTLDTEERVYFGRRKISAMILANGVLWTFWITVCVPKAISLGTQIPAGQFIFLVLVEAGWLASTVLVAYSFSRFRGALSNPKVVPYIFKLFVAVFVYFAASMLYQSLRFFLLG